MLNGSRLRPMGPGCHPPPLQRRARARSLGCQKRAGHRLCAGDRRRNDV